MSKRKREDDMELDNISSKETKEPSSTQRDDFIADEFPDHKGGENTLQWHRDNYPPVDPNSPAFFRTSQLVYLICLRVGLTSLKRWKKITKQRRSWFIRTCCRFVDVDLIEDDVNDAPTDENTTLSRIQVYDVVMHVFKLFKSGDPVEFQELQDEKCDELVSGWWEKYMVHCLKCHEAVIYPKQARQPIELPAAQAPIDRVIDRASRHHYIPSSSDADEDSDDNITLGAMRADIKNEREENMTVGQLRNKIKKQNSTRKNTPKTPTAKKDIKQQTPLESPSSRTRAARGTPFRHQSSDSEESADRDSGGEVFVDDFNADTLVNEQAEEKDMFNQYEPDDPTDFLCDLSYVKQTELTKYLRRYLCHHRVFKELAIREYNIWGKRAALRSVHLGINGGKGWEVGSVQMAVWSLKDHWSMKVTKPRRPRSTQRYKPL